jgi:hypothetical protein
MEFDEGKADRIIIYPEDSWSRLPQGSLLLIGERLSARLGKRCQMADQHHPHLLVGFSGLRLAYVCCPELPGTEA